MTTISDIPHSPLPTSGPGAPISWLDDIHLWLAENGGYLADSNLWDNGAFDYWPQSVSIVCLASATASTAARWTTSCLAGSNHLVTRQAFALGQTEVPGNPKYFMRVVKSGGGVLNSSLQQRIESVTTSAGLPLSVSFYAKGDATLASNFSVSVNQYFGSGGGPSGPVFTTLGTVTVPAASGWTLYTITGTIPSISGKTLGSNGDDYIEVGVNLGTAGNVTHDFALMGCRQSASPVAFPPLPLERTLQRVGRYFQMTYQYGVIPGTVTDLGAVQRRAVAASGTEPMISERLPIRMRAAPVVLWYSPSTLNKSGFVRNVSTPADVAYTTVGTAPADDYTGVNVLGVAPVAGDFIRAHWTAIDSIFM